MSKISNDVIEIIDGSDDGYDNEEGKILSNDTKSENNDKELMIPLNLLMTGTPSAGNDCNLLVQVNPDDASTLDFHGASGAVGRFEVNDDVVTMDFKGFQYQGVINPGPTALIATMHPKIGENVIKVESITDEFITLEKVADSMLKLDAVVEMGNMDRSYDIQDRNVNDRNDNVNLPPSKDDSTKEAKTPKKRGKGASTGVASKKRRKK
mmetsp:Transcript_3838/g.5028  ORF Transcript_3838/g.5028 Transcript_3838/m.5028 type:complete len:209 (+) Transcript_3838:185-811(+)